MDHWIGITARWAIECLSARKSTASAGRAIFGSTASCSRCRGSWSRCKWRKFGQPSCAKWRLGPRKRCGSWWRCPPVKRGLRLVRLPRQRHTFHSQAVERTLPGNRCKAQNQVNHIRNCSSRRAHLHSSNSRSRLRRSCRAFTYWIAFEILGLSF